MQRLMKKSNKLIRHCLKYAASYNRVDTMEEVECRETKGSCCNCFAKTRFQLALQCVKGLTK